MQLQRRAIIAQDAGGNPNHSKENGEFTSGSGGSTGAEKVAKPVNTRPTLSDIEKTRNAGEHQNAVPLYKDGKLNPEHEKVKTMKGAEAAAEFEGPVKAGPADPDREHYPNRWPKDSPQQKKISEQLAELHKGKGAEEKFMHPKTKSGAENLPLAALRKHVTAAVESGESEAITEQPAEQKYKSELGTERGRQHHRSIAAAFNSGTSKKIGNYSTDGKAIYLHGNKIVEKGPNGEINFTLAGWPTATTRAALSDFGIRVGQSKGKQTYSHSGGTEEINENDTYRAKDEQPDMALDPNSAAVNSPTPWKGRNLDNDPVGDRSASPDLASAGGSDCNVYTGRDLG